MGIRSQARGLLLLAFLFGCNGCARIQYLKVPSPTQYETWSDADQRRADSMEGPRYYLPRPWVNLKQPVPVASRTAFVSLEYRGAVTAPMKDKEGKPVVVDGKTKMLVITPAHYDFVIPTSACWLKSVLPDRISISEAKEFFSPDARKAAREEKETADPSGNPTPPPGEAPKAEKKPPTHLSGSVGFINREDPVTRLGEVLDVVYLPDMEEQFVIRRDYGLGAGDLQVQLRNGWCAEVFGETVDNSNLIPYILDQVQSASDTALNVGKSWGLKSVDQIKGLTEIAPPAAKEESEKEAAQEQGVVDLLGRMVLLKVVQVRVAQQGLYPILKPREILDWYCLKGKCHGNACWTCASCDPQEDFKKFLRQKNLPWIDPDQVFVPAAPFTMVGFNAVTDAYIGPVTKDQLGLGTYTTGGGDGSGGGQAKEDLNALLTWLDGLVPTEVKPKVVSPGAKIEQMKVGTALSNACIVTYELRPLVELTAAESDSVLKGLTDGVATLKLATLKVEATSAKNVFTIKGIAPAGLTQEVKKLSK